MARDANSGPDSPLTDRRNRGQFLIAGLLWAAGGGLIVVTCSCALVGTCYFFVRPKEKYLELCIFLGRRLEAPQVRRVDHASKSKLYHPDPDHTSGRRA